MRCRRITNVGKRDRSIGCILAGGKDRWFEVQFEVVQMCHRDASRGSRSDAPAVSLLKSGEFGYSAMLVGLSYGSQF